MSGAVGILIVDDNAVDREALRRLLPNRFRVVEAATATEGIARIDEKIDCALLDYRLPDVDGLSALEEYTARGLAVILVTGTGNESVAVAALKQGAADYLRKDALSGETVTRAVERAIERLHLERQIADKDRLLKEKLVELEQTNRQLRDREVRLQVILEQLPGLTWTTDATLTFKSVTGNWAMTDSSNTALLGAPLAAGFGSSAEALDAHQRALAGDKRRFSVETKTRAWECSVEPLRSPDGAIIGTIGVGLDITERRNFEAQLRQAQKLEAVGRLAGGLAHDFNNLLTAIHSCASFANDALPPDSPARTDIEEISAATRRAASLTRQLLTFSRQQPTRPLAVDVASLLRGLDNLLQRLLGEDVSLELTTGVDLHAVYLDPGHLEQVVVNLAINARDAMPTGGRLRIHASNLSRNDPLIAQLGLPRAEYVSIEVQDEGTGIDPDQLPHIFEPFYSTKPLGKGTGLGLATCYGIVRGAGGDLGVTSEPGRGTTIRIVLPRCGRAVISSVPHTQPPDSVGSETVLVVEDEPTVRRVVRRCLERAGYQVLEADSGEMGEQIAREHAGTIHLVLTDMVLPGMNGHDVVEAVRRARPEIAALLMSGYAPEAMVERGLENPRYMLLPKPFTPALLRAKVREVLDDHGSYLNTVERSGTMPVGSTESARRNIVSDG